MENPVPCGKYHFNHLRLTGSTFNDMCLVSDLIAAYEDKEG